MWELLLTLPTGGVHHWKPIHCGLTACWTAQRPDSWERGRASRRQSGWLSLPRGSQIPAVWLYQTSSKWGQRPPAGLGQEFLSHNRNPPSKLIVSPTTAPEKVFQRGCERKICRARWLNLEQASSMHTPQMNTSEAMTAPAECVTTVPLPLLSCYLSAGWSPHVST